MNALTFAKELEAKLIDNIRNETFRIEEATTPENGDSPFKAKLDQLFEEHPLVQEPYLELTPSYIQGCSLQELVNDGCILNKTADIFATYFGGSADQIRLHRHQENAVRAACRYEGNNPKNMVVCAGTGSGKTECFLLPVIDTLLRMQENGTLEGEVYVMLLYPLNALVNDQLIRLRKLLNGTGIRFGKYTGELKAEQDEERLNWDNYNFPQPGETTEDHQLAFDGTAPVENEVTKRSEWKNANTRGHIMVTNYSMLERLLLNPKHSELFTNNWKYIVIDEAHSYNGSLGTDMAWLMRRLVHRLGETRDLRFLATSATLSNNAEIVRNEFASKLFPASPDTFEVIFGEQDNEFHPVANAPQELPNLQEIRNLTIEPLPILDSETNLIKATQRFEALKEYNEKGLFNTLADIAAEDYVSFADAVFILKMLKALKEDNKIGHFPERGFFTDTTPLNSLLGLLRHWYHLADKGEPENAFNISNSKVREFWREYLHDCIDSHKSPYSADILGQGGGRNPVGNRLNILTAWEENNFNELDSLTYLLKIADNCVFSIKQSHPEQDIPVGTIRLQFSNETREAIQDFNNWRENFCNDLNAARDTIERAWSEHISNYPPNAANSYRYRIAWLLSGGNENSYPSQVYRQLLNRETAENTRLSQLAAATGFNNIEEGTERIDTLFALGSLARCEGSRFPVLDLRIHQFVRGMKPVGIYNLHEMENGQWDFELTGNQEPEIVKGETIYPVFNLGVCLHCGAPYILGYKNDAGRQLARYLDDEHPTMVAFMFPGLELDPPYPTHSQAFVNFKTGEMTDNLDRHGDNAIQLHYLEANPDKPEALSRCLCCQGQITEGNRYHLIKPFEASSASATTKLQMVTVDTLAKAADSSGDPMAYALPGQGRKLLVFSDSRQGAARSVIRYQEYLVNSTLKDLLCVLCREDTSNNIAELAQKIYDNDILFNHMEAENNVAQDAQDNGEDAEEARNRYRNNFLNNFSGRPYRQFGVFKLLMEQNRLTALFDLSDGDNDLAEVQVARFRFLQALRSGGFRNNPIWNHKIEITSKRLNRVFRENGQTLLHILAIQQFGQEHLNNLCQNIYRWLFLKCAISKDKLGGINVIWDDGLGELNKYKENCPRETACRKKWIKYFVNQAFKEINIQLNDNQLKDTIRYLWDNIFTAGADPVLSTDGCLKIFRSSPYDGGLGFDFSISFEQQANANELDTKSLIPLTIQEHTAQISKKYGKAFQEAFSTGKINILSCSTTFEMGVDLGDLNCLYMSNLPPSAANYRQRAGRAGRRAGSVAYVLTMLGSGENDDEYYFDHATDFIFGEVEPPHIYLDNPVYRARHLRAEAFHKFWKYMMNDDRLQDPQGTRYNPQEPTTVNRNMELCSHFFAGYKVMSHVELDNDRNFIRHNFRETMNFNPIVSNLNDWYENQHDNVNEYIRNISNAENVEYDIAADFIWQLTGDKEPWGEEQEADKYGELGGRKQSDQPLAVDFRESYERLRNADAEHNISGAAYHLMQEQTIERLCRKRILPKYGFPVDVISLMPADDDPCKIMTDGMEREKNIAIYEYAPDMTVIANKRIFKSASPLFNQHGKLTANNRDEIIQTRWYRCPSCKNVFETNNENGLCECCGDNHLQEIRVCSPDGFSASRSTKYSFSTPLDSRKGCRVNTTFNRFENTNRVPGLNLETGTSLTAEIVYLNTGFKGNGFRLGDNEENNYHIYHKCMTDIVFWRPTGLAANRFNWDGPRFRKAMLSTGSAIIKAAADVLHIRRNEVGVISFPYEARLGFVLYDTTPGGNGILTELALCNDQEKNESRKSLIHDIIQKAHDICSNCVCFETRVEDLDLTPASFTQVVQDAENYRHAASCYKCLRDYSNQADHTKLDRYDAAKILYYILHPEPEQIQMAGENQTNPPPGFVHMQDDFEPIGACCIMKDGNTVIFTAAMNREDILYIEED